MGLIGNFLLLLLAQIAQHLLRARDPGTCACAAGVEQERFFPNYFGLLDFAVAVQRIAFFQQLINPGSNGPGEHLS